MNYQSNFNYLPYGSATTFEWGNFLKSVNYSSLKASMLDDILLFSEIAPPEIYTNFKIKNKKTSTVFPDLVEYDHDEEIYVPLKIKRRFTVKAKVIRRSKWEPQPFIDY